MSLDLVNLPSCKLKLAKAELREKFSVLFIKKGCEHFLVYCIASQKGVAFKFQWLFKAKFELVHKYTFIIVKSTTAERK